MSGIIRFDEFALDCDRFELLRAGHRLKLERIPMELLILLVAKNGRLVTREEIIDCLWGHDVFLDTDHGINTAMREVRNVLRDDPEQPRFVQTVTGKGYRFIAPTTTLSPATGNGSPGFAGSISAEVSQPESRPEVPDHKTAGHASPVVGPAKPTDPTGVSQAASRSSTAAMIALVSALALMFASVLYTLAAGGHEIEARKILSDLEEKSKHAYVPAYNLAIIHLALHENETALHYLQKAYEERDWAMMVLAVEPRLDPLRNSPAFQALLEKVKLS